jgi:RNA polymerase sigma factor (sigma-70 family)
MANAQPGPGLSRLRRAIQGYAADGRSDEELLARFIAAREEAAFTALVRRHGPMVLGVCQRVLHNRQDAEDAFQATFVVLARRAPSLREPARLGSWLYVVASRVARTARERAARRRIRERQAAPMPDAEPPPDGTWQELRTCTPREDRGRSWVEGHKVRVFDLTTGREKVCLAVDRMHQPQAFTRDGKVLATVSNRHAHLWELASGRERWRSPDLGPWPSSLTLAPDGRGLAVGLSDTTALVFDVAGWR